jgi:hypothetical protein
MPSLVNARRSSGAACTYQIYSVLLALESICLRAAALAVMRAVVADVTRFPTLSLRDCMPCTEGRHTDRERHHYMLAGFMSTPDDRTVHLDLSVAAPYGFDKRLLREGAHVGLLGLQHETRRRNRVNGHVTEVTGTSVTMAVDQSFGNCPKYIQKRPVRCDEAQLAALHAPGHEAPRVEEAAHLQGRALEVVNAAGASFLTAPRALGSTQLALRVC